MDLACFALGVTPQAVYRLVKLRQLKAQRRKGRAIEFDVASLMKLVKVREARGKHPGRPSLFERAIKRHGVDAVADGLAESIAKRPDAKQCFEELLAADPARNSRPAESQTTDQSTAGSADVRAGL
jgi:hypothetical protein